MEFATLLPADKKITFSPGFNGFFRLKGISASGSTPSDPEMGIIILQDVPYDRTEILVWLMYEGMYRMKIVVKNGFNSVTTLFGDDYFFTMDEGDERVVAGGAMVCFRTDCGCSEKDVSVLITITPNHQNGTAEITYSVSPKEPKEKAE